MSRTLLCCIAALPRNKRSLRASSDISHCARQPAISGQSTDARRGILDCDEHCKLPSVPQQILKDIPTPSNSASRDD
jgi:hypothetical protein